MKSKHSLLQFACIFSGVLLIGNLKAQSGDNIEAQNAPLPSPLTLEYVMQNVGQTHPDLLQAQSQIDLHNASLLQAESAYGLRAYVLGEARYIEPSPIAPDPNQEDHRVRLVAEKRLYDFGRTANAEQAARSDVKSSEWLYENARNQYRINVMEAFFNVLLADLQFIRNNEAMSGAFINYDRIRMRNEMGQRSDIELLEAQSQYQSVRRNLYASQASQRSTRSRLANILHRPGELVAEIVEPENLEVNKPLPEVEELQAVALTNNPVIKALRAQVEAAEKRLYSARAGYWPTIDGAAQVADYERLGGNYNDWEVSLIVNVPLLTGGTINAQVTRQQAELIRFKAKLEKAQMDVQQAVLENWQLLDTLRIEREETQALLDYRDLYLDRSRALYEMEVKTDLGDSMVQVSEARLRLAKAKFSTVLAWARLDALLGKEVYGVKENK